MYATPKQEKSDNSLQCLVNTGNKNKLLFCVVKRRNSHQRKYQMQNIVFIHWSGWKNTVCGRKICNAINRYSKHGVQKNTQNN